MSTRPSRCWRPPRCGLALAVALGLLLGCRTSGPPTSIRSSPPQGAATGQPDVADSARVSFQFDQLDTHRTYPPRSIHLWYDAGTGEQYLPGAILALTSDLQQYLRHGGMYPTPTSGELHIRVHLLGSVDEPMPLASATLTLPLKPDWRWSVRVSIRRADEPLNHVLGISGGGDPHVAVPIVGGRGQPTGDVLYLRASGIAFSAPPVVP